MFSLVLIECVAVVFLFFGCFFFVFVLLINFTKSSHSVLPAEGSITMRCITQR